MRTILSKLIGVAALFGVTMSTGAQVLPNPVLLPFPSFKWDQRYTPPRAVFPSRVATCGPIPSPVVAMDDWQCTKPGPILRVDWWGWLRTPAQAQRPFYIAVYRENPNNTCQPGAQPIYQACVVPDQVRRVAKNCQTIAGTAGGLPIYYLSAKLPNPFFQDGTPTAPQHFFLQISEIDSSSVQVGVDDFCWAGRRPIQVCPALQRFAGGGIVQPLLDACDQQPDDLSFRLRSRGVAGTLNPNIPVPGSVTFRLFTPGDVGPGREIEVLSWSWGASNPTAAPQPGENNFSVDFDSPDGNYILEVHVPGALPQHRPIVLQEGTEFQVDSFFDVFLGDLNGDRAINTTDLTAFLANFGRASQ
ncbi:MAG: hypothetical protein ACKVZJ_15315 [Phycisphaerales bacterium]